MTARERLLHPVCLVAIATLVFNDHWLKAHHPSWLTGKLSDAAGLVFFPFVLASLLPIRDVRRAVLVATIATAIGFALVKTLPAATDMYCHALGALQWLVHPWAHYAPVAAVVDPTDLLAVPFLAVPMLVIRRSPDGATC